MLRISCFRSAAAAICLCGGMLGSGLLLGAEPPKVTKVIEFNTPEADAIMEKLQMFPADNAMNTKVTDWPVAKNSDALITSIGKDKFLRYNPDMAYIIVPPDYKKIDVVLGEMAEESDKGPYPVPDNLPIEGWPILFEREGIKKTLAQLQVKGEDEPTDRHAIILDPTNKKLYEYFVMHKDKGKWKAEGAAIFDLSSNKLRPAGWTSADAAGLPILPLTVRYDELKAGEIKHALRLTIVNSRKAHVYPATHDASTKEDENLPRMGERIRLKADFDTSNFSPEVETILSAMKEYGIFVADNGIDWAISVTPDPRIPALHDELRKIKGSNFEVIVPPPGYKKPR
jgi:hypothetical protein